jgi:SnoaL-like protein
MALELDAATLQALMAGAERAAIENVLGLYCRAIDRLDVQLLKSVYHPDGIDDHGAMCLNAHEFAERIVETVAQLCVYSMHTVTHAVIDVGDGVARSEAYYLGYHTVASGEEAIGKFFGTRYLEAQRRAGMLDQRHEYICGGRYLDVFQKRDGVWRIFRRRITNEFSVSRPEATTSEGIPGMYFRPGSRDRADPVYQLVDLQAQLIGGAGRGSHGS